MKRDDYQDVLKGLQRELVAMQNALVRDGRRLVVVFEGRDAAGKGGAIKAITEKLNTRGYRIAALPKPDERERTQWYFQRYVAHLPAAGELVLFDRSWYNRAGVERVMGYCSDAEYRRFLRECPKFERMLVDDGIQLLKYWLAVDQAEQEQRFAERAADPAKRWKLSPIDLVAREKYADYGRARDRMFEATHTAWAPWHVVDFNDQKRGRLNLIRHLLEQVPHDGAAQPAVKLPPLKGKPKREKLEDASLWVREAY
ncbi:polyphosphate kinase 2, PA0141 family [Mizugakiibacter sediminis]|uniref:ADP/GDP-polyphosphate phosphotransferase n=1 Tax=Mizugakiibacter sediminis TaxID=1475481 RepID=A0A0K8QPV1_9GAMM|nr:polyphosphate kinase 2 [Mizugakiibacter sediminis]GAP66706.1 polyphosphate kinase 2, PA0141 family [Mizugakiibacter sediminis]